MRKWGRIYTFDISLLKEVVPGDKQIRFSVASFARWLERGTQKWGRTYTFDIWLATEVAAGDKQIGFSAASFVRCLEHAGV